MALNNTEVPNLDELWNIADIAINDNDESIKKPKDFCNHKYNTENECITCGHTCYISYGAEWNNYKDSATGEYAKSNQRGDLYVDPNPYSKSGTIIPFNNKSLIGRMQIQQTFSHKQKTYWLIGLEFEHAATLLNIKNDCIDTAKHYWHKYMESGKLTRASVRKGLIASCLLHSCIHHKVPIEREQIIKVFDCSTKTLSKGEKVLFEILNISNLTYTGIVLEEYFFTF